MTLDDRLARARADQREHAWISRRLDDARADRERVVAQLAVSETSRDYEQADVDRHLHGVGAFFRGLFADGFDLTEDQQRLAATQLLCDELEGEVRAIDAYIAELTTRAGSVADAEARYTAALAEAEEAARARGELEEELDTLAVTEADLAWQRVEIAEAIAIGIDVQKSFIHVVDLVRRLSPQPDYEEPVLGESLLAAITGRTGTVYSELTSTLAHATHGLRRFAAACGALSSPAAGLEPRFPPLPSTDGFVIRDVVWTNSGPLGAILPEVSRVSSALSSAVGELRRRDSSIGQAIAECARVRAHLLDPAAR